MGILILFMLLGFGGNNLKITKDMYSITIKYRHLEEPAEFTTNGIYRLEQISKWPEHRIRKLNKFAKYLYECVDCKKVILIYREEYKTIWEAEFKLGGIEFYNGIGWLCSNCKQKRVEKLEQALKELKE